ncbi:MAG: thioredoxin domain-containing protein [Candidatus Thermoplasmatota archaeon]|mgnify:CR=1 FL=1
MAASNASGKANRLASEPSPYLRQHAHNPVDWWPWGEAAFAEARRRDVPVFLSIGYATCHWCHVMAHESFEDDAVAQRMNEAFVSVKVDREERPDIDETYMAVAMQMTGHGGWPLTAILDHKKRAFFAGTYFPKESRHGRIGMMELVPRITEAWQGKRAELEAQAEHILQHLRGEAHNHGDEEVAASSAATADLEAPVLSEAVEAFSKRFDAKHGGFGGAPKFPSPHNILFLLRAQHRTNDRKTLAMVSRTLHAMADGGVHDHVGGGFHRYSTDREWLLPHFEKMLYDQAMLAMAYTEAFQATGEPRFAAVARSTLDYVLRDLADPAGGYRCAEDADAEDEEGKYTVWSHAELATILGKDATRFAALYGVQKEGNFHDEATRRKNGANILHLSGPLSDRDEAWAAPLRAKLLAVRDRRVHPLLDDKVLTDWNGLAIAAFAKAGVALREPRYIDAAQRAATFLGKTMRRPDGRLRHRFHHGKVDDHAFLDDHAYLLWALLELHQATLDGTWLERAVEVATQMETHFAHPGGGWWTTPHDGEALGARKRDAGDGALPSGNATASWCLHRLALLTGDTTWRDAADRALAAHGEQARAFPHGFPTLLMALDLALGPTRELVVAGSGSAADALLALGQEGYRPRMVLLRADAATAKMAPWTSEHKPLAGKAAAYLCEGQSCKAPTTDATVLRRLLE